MEMVDLICNGLQMFNNRVPSAIMEFPAVSEGFLAMLGVSHASYLTSKTIDRTKASNNFSRER
jgi:hypothetical protein